MLFRSGVEEGGFMRGMELLPIDTVLKDSKTRLQTSGEIAHVDGVLSRLSGCYTGPCCLDKGG